MLVIVTLSILAMIIGWSMARLLEEQTDADGNKTPTPPPERHPSAASYCPKCKAEYRSSAGQVPGHVNHDDVLVAAQQ
jgi:hypothetical protein